MIYMYFILFIESNSYNNNRIQKKNKNKSYD